MRERMSPGMAVHLGWAGVELKEVKPQSAALPWPDPPSELGILRPFLPGLFGQTQDLAACLPPGPHPQKF